VGFCWVSFVALGIFLQSAEPAKIKPPVQIHI
jgi:hypothetical protein